MSNGTESIRRESQRAQSLRPIAAQESSIPADWQLLFSSDVISRSISRISYEIVERNRDLDRLAIVGIKTAGEHIARRIHAKIKEIEGVSLPIGVIDITLYRDDISPQPGAQDEEKPILQGSEFPFEVAGAKIILVDDVLYSGRTIRAALDAIVDHGRPAAVQLAVLADRGHREFPIRADYVGKNLPTNHHEYIKVRLSEMGFEDGVYLVK